MDALEVNRQFFHPLCHYLERHGADWQTAEECADDALMAWFLTANKPAEEKLQGWLFVTALRKFRDVWRKNKRALQPVEITDDAMIVLQISGSREEEREDVDAFITKHGGGYTDYLRLIVSHGADHKGIEEISAGRYNIDYQYRVRQRIRETVSASMGVKNLFQVLKGVHCLHEWITASAIKQVERFNELGGPEDAVQGNREYDRLCMLYRDLSALACTAFGRAFINLLIGYAFSSLHYEIIVKQIGSSAANSHKRLKSLQRWDSLLQSSTWNVIASMVSDIRKYYSAPSICCDFDEYAEKDFARSTARHTLPLLVSNDFNQGVSHYFNS